MALFEGEGWYFEVSEWWSGYGEGELYHQYNPDELPFAEITEEELEFEAHTLTGHLVWYDEDGVMISEKYFQMESDDGWLMDELEVEVDDAEDRYGVTS